jgi:hypothetical protein
LWGKIKMEGNNGSDQAYRDCDARPEDDGPVLH